jgi:hypothetical protein
MSTLSTPPARFSLGRVAKGSFMEGNHIAQSDKPRRAAPSVDFHRELYVRFSVNLND